ncbi:MAG: fluoride efflux transporter CrcB [Ignavibacteria bacterium]|nr:fluoride efflux transporter CrcB [Ignavibacteria bacterium]
MLKIILVFIGGGIGAVGRYMLSGAVHRVFGSDFPYGTLTVNVAGCFLIGFLMFGLEERFLLNPALRIFLTIGILGGFTTFSSFSFETIALLRDGEILFATLNIGTSIVVCLVATYLGTLTGKLL